MSRMQKVVTGVLVSGVLGGSKLAAAHRAVPFKGGATGTLTSQEVLGPEDVKLEAVGEGQATLIGSYTRLEELHLNPATGAFTGQITFITARGDTLDCTVLGQFTSQTEAAGTYTMVGGTGRFESAAGEAAFKVTQTSPTTFVVRFDGALSR